MEVRFSASTSEVFTPPKTLSKQELINTTINTAIDALRGDAEAIQAKIEALEGSLSLDAESDGATPPKPKSRKGRPKKVPTALELTSQKKTRGRPKKTVEAVEESAPKDKVKAATEPMRKYWADRKKAQ